MNNLVRPQLSQQQLAEALMAVLRRLPAGLVAFVGLCILGAFLLDARSDAKRYIRFADSPVFEAKITGAAVAIFTKTFGWLLILSGVGMALQLVIPLVATLPIGGKRRLDELRYYSELKYRAESGWSWILGVIWVAGTVAAIVGGMGQLDG